MGKIKKAVTTKAVTTKQTIEVPVVAIPADSGYARRRFEVTLDREQAVTLAGILRGLQDTGATMSNGKAVVNSFDVVRWIIEQVSAEVDSAVA